MDDYFVFFEKTPKMNFSICTKYDSQFSSYKGIYLIKIGDEYYVGKQILHLEDGFLTIVY